MFGSLRKHWHHFTSRPPGRRFKSFYEERQEKRGSGGAGKKWGLIVTGAAMAIAGVLLLPLPGPGSIVLVAGLGLLSSESLTMARVLDAADRKRAAVMKVLHRMWRRSAKMRRLLIAGAVVIVLLLAAGVVWWWTKMS
jgi:uncharacterized protein (TIGR02611 family)